jgi:hypothetical protein
MPLSLQLVSGFESGDVLGQVLLTEAQYLLQYSRMHTGTHAHARIAQNLDQVSAAISSLISSAQIRTVQTALMFLG